MDTTYFDTLGEIRPDWMIDLLAEKSEGGSLKLVFWKNRQIYIGQVLTIDWAEGSKRSVYRPQMVDPSVLRSIYFPSRVDSDGGTRELHEGLCRVIKRFAPMTDVHASLLAYAILASWVVEFTEVPVCVALVGPPSPERRQLLRVLRCLFRRALQLGEASVAGLSSLPMAITPTLFIERCDSSSQLRKLLEATSSREAQVLSKGRILNTYCAKVVCVEESLNEMMPDWPMIEIPVPEICSPASSLNSSAQLQIADEFQSKLLMFRLKNYGLVRDSAFALPELSAAGRDIARCLGASVEGDTELQAQLALSLRENLHQIRTSAENPLYSAIIEGLLSLSHQLKKESAGVAEITKAANVNLEKRGELLELNPRAVGSLLRTLGFPTRRLGATGRGIILLNSIRDRIHKLAGEYNLLRTPLRSLDCAQCEQLIWREDEADSEKKLDVIYDAIS
jgi:hypothetical protein